MSSVNLQGSTPQLDTRYLVYPLPYPPLSHSPSYYNPWDWPSEPIFFFCDWFREAEKVYSEHLERDVIPEANVMQIATTKDGRPRVRTVLLKGIVKDGFIFFTNYNSNKGKELEESSYAALNFYWNRLHRQVRIEGSIEKVSRGESKHYFQTRPIGSQISATVSDQSQPIESRVVLEQKYIQMTRDYLHQHNIDTSRAREKKMVIKKYWIHWMR